MAEDNDDLTSKIFVYLRSDESHVSTLDIGASTLSPSSTVGCHQQQRPARHVVQRHDALRRRPRGHPGLRLPAVRPEPDDDKNLDLDSANADPWGLWFDGRVLWVADTADDKLYVYDLPGAQPGNTAADGDAGGADTQRASLDATLTAATNAFGVGYSPIFLNDCGTLSPSATFNLSGVTYTIRELVIDNLGNLNFHTNERIPQRFSLSIAGTSYSSTDAIEDDLTTEYRYIWEIQAYPGPPATPSQSP